MDEVDRIRLVRDPDRPNGPRTLMGLSGVFCGVSLVIAVVEVVAQSSVIAPAIFVAIAAMMLGLGHLARIDWSVEISADEVRFLRAKGLTVRTRDIRVRRSDFAGYKRSEPYRGSRSVTLLHSDGSSARRFINVATEVADGDQIDAAMARFAIPRLET